MRGWSGNGLILRWLKQRECSFGSLTDRQTILGRFDVNLKSFFFFCPSHPTHRTGWTITGCSLERIHCDTHARAHLQQHCFTKTSTSPFNSLGNPDPHILKSSVAPYSGTEQSSRTTLCNVVFVREWVCVIRSSLLALHFPVQFKCSQPLSTFRQFKSSRIIAEMYPIFYRSVLFYESKR